MSSKFSYPCTISCVGSEYFANVLIIVDATAARPLERWAAFHDRMQKRKKNFANVAKKICAIALQRQVDQLF